MALEFSFGKRVDAKQLVRLYRQTEWANRRSEDRVKQMLAHSTVLLSVWDRERLVAFARAVSDGACKAMIDDVVVDEKMRGQGIGSELVRRMIARLNDVEVVFLHCGESMVEFYERFGFHRAKAVYMQLAKER